MSSIRQEFVVRVKETEGYFELLYRLDSAVTAVFEDSSGDRTHLESPAETLKTLKGAAFLLLYNLVESTMRNGIIAIFDELKGKNVSFDDVRKELRIIALKNLKAMKPEEQASRITILATDIFASAFRPDELFNGNIDAQKIRETARVYGFSAQTNARVTKSGEKLKTVKRNRNDLGHGHVSFEEVGRDHSTVELREIKDQIIAFISDIISNIEKYIAEQRYLASDAVEVYDEPQPSEGDVIASADTEAA